MFNLTGLIDYTNELTIDTEDKYFSEEEALELYDTCFDLMKEFIYDNPKVISEPDFQDIFDENIKELMSAHFDSDILYTEEAEEELEDIIEQASKDFFKDFIPPRSYKSTVILKEPNYSFIDSQLDILRNKPQPEQRTKEWYEFRHNLITASNAYKAFENQNVQNQLIYEKCQPLNTSLYIDEDASDNEDTKQIIMVNTNTTLHWGQKYEPLSVKIYEYNYNTKIEDFGCIQHDIYKFVGASPDGINIDRESSRYGRMLEIKNIVNREIDGIPKKEYWIQMQLQMEVCNLDECDFLETRFIEYPDYSTFKNDSSDEIFEDEQGLEFIDMCTSKDNKLKGEIIYFHTKEGKPFYCYKPLDLIHPQDISEWEEKILDLYQGSNYNYMYMKTIYWKLEEISCVLVCRNRHWFKENITDLENIWRTIEQERQSGFEHRAPNRKMKKETVDLNTEASNGCLLQFNKDTGKINVIKKFETIDLILDIPNT